LRNLKLGRVAVKKARRLLAFFDGTIISIKGHAIQYNFASSAPILPSGCPDGQLVARPSTDRSGTARRRRVCNLGSVCGRPLPVGSVYLSRFLLYEDLISHPRKEE
jgi:hypothetical protein